MNQELDLLDKVELRFGLAQNETDFEAQVVGLLVPVLLKLDSPHQAVRDKVGLYRRYFPHIYRLNQVDDGLIFPIMSSMLLCPLLTVLHP